MPVLIALDYGSRRVGIAASDESGTLATAVGVHDAATDGSLFAYLRELIAARDARGLVVGLPLEEDGREGPAAQRVREFSRRLAAATGLPVALVDERYSSREADARLREGGRRRRPKWHTDAAAAEIILQQHLDRLRAAGPEGAA